MVLLSPWLTKMDEPIGSSPERANWTEWTHRTASIHRPDGSNATKGQSHLWVDSRMDLPQFYLPPAVNIAPKTLEFQTVSAWAPPVESDNIYLPQQRDPSFIPVRGYPFWSLSP
jgi:hypothetical protein